MNTQSASASEVVHIGVDICADWLDIHGIPRKKKAFRLANTTAGHRKLVAMLPSGVHVILEATAATNRPSRWPCCAQARP
ncbi:hypothetical protein [Prosthecobacter sp.]|uniref:hypothetical protein n=1 Tax=Prosthecobacter sp. TaxID=1965333 RepID=UPI003784E047